MKLNDIAIGHTGVTRLIHDAIACVSKLSGVDAMAKDRAKTTLENMLRRTNSAGDDPVTLTVVLTNFINDPSESSLTRMTDLLSGYTPTDRE